MASMSEAVFGCQSPGILVGWDSPAIPGAPALRAPAARTRGVGGDEDHVAWESPWESSPGYWSEPESTTSELK